MGLELRRSNPPRGREVVVALLPRLVRADELAALSAALDAAARGFATALNVPIVPKITVRFASDGAQSAPVVIESDHWREGVSAVSWRRVISTVRGRVATRGDQAEFLAWLADHASPDDRVRATVEGFREIVRADPTLLFSGDDVRTAWAVEFPSVADNQQIAAQLASHLELGAALPDPAEIASSLGDPLALEYALERTLMRRPRHVEVLIAPDDWGALTTGDATIASALEEGARQLSLRIGVHVAFRIEADPSIAAGRAGLRIGVLRECDLVMIADGMALVPASESRDAIAIADGDWGLTDAEQTSGANALTRTDALAASVMDLMRLRSARLWDAASVARVFEDSPMQVVDAALERVGLQPIVKLFRELARHGVPVADSRAILAAVASFDRVKADPRTSISLTRELPCPEESCHPPTLTELAAFVQLALGRQTAGTLANGGPWLQVNVLDRKWESLAAKGALSREEATNLRRTVRMAIEDESEPAVVLTSIAAVREIRNALATELPLVSVVSYEELPSEASLTPVGQIRY